MVWKDFTAPAFSCCLFVGLCSISTWVSEKWDQVKNIPFLSVLALLYFEGHNPSGIQRSSLTVSQSSQHLAKCEQMVQHLIVKKHSHHQYPPVTQLHWQPDMDITSCDVVVIPFVPVIFRGAVVELLLLFIFIDCSTLLYWPLLMFLLSFWWDYYVFSAKCSFPRFHTFWDFQWTASKC